MRHHNPNFKQTLSKTIRLENIYNESLLFLKFAFVCKLNCIKDVLKEEHVQNSCTFSSDRKKFFLLYSKRTNDNIFLIHSRNRKSANEINLVQCLSDMFDKVYLLLLITIYKPGTGIVNSFFKVCEA